MSLRNTAVLRWILCSLCSSISRKPKRLVKSLSHLHPCPKWRQSQRSLLRATAGHGYSFRIFSKETLRIMDPKYPILDMIQWIRLKCGSCTWIHYLDLDFSKETDNLFLNLWSGFGFLKRNAPLVFHVAACILRWAKISLAHFLAVPVVI